MNQKKKNYYEFSYLQCRDIWHPKMPVSRRSNLAACALCAELSIVINRSSISDPAAPTTASDDVL